MHRQSKTTSEASLHHLSNKIQNQLLRQSIIASKTVMLKANNISRQILWAFKINVCALNQLFCASECTNSELKYTYFSSDTAKGSIMSLIFLLFRRTRCWCSCNKTGKLIFTSRFNKTHEFWIKDAMLPIVDTLLIAQYVFNKNINNNIHWRFGNDAV